MIVFDLECRGGGHRFEGWFGSSDDFAGQVERSLVCCPECGSPDVIKAPMAPKLARKSNQLVRAQAARKPSSIAPPGPPAPQSLAGGGMPPEAVQMMRTLHAMQTEALKQSRWVGDKFADTSRAIHYGERDAEVIHGQATIAEAKALFEEGIEVAPLPFPIAPPGETN